MHAYYCSCRPIIYRLCRRMILNDDDDEDVSSVVRGCISLGLPVCSHPSSSTVALVASRLFMYPIITCGPLMQISQRSFGPNVFFVSGSITFKQTAHHSRNNNYATDGTYGL